MYIFLERITVATHTERPLSVAQCNGISCDIDIMQNV